VITKFCGADVGSAYVLTYVPIVLHRLERRSCRTRVCGTCAASNSIRAFRYACGRLRALRRNDRSEKSHLGKEACTHGSEKIFCVVLLCLE